jgi:hypothetical protein
MPHLADALPRAGPGSYEAAVRRGIHSSASPGVVRSAGTAAKVIVIGQPWPASACPELMYIAARATCAPSRPDVHGSECSSCSEASAMSWW